MDLHFSCGSVMFIALIYKSFMQSIQVKFITVTTSLVNHIFKKYKISIRGTGDLGDFWLKRRPLGDLFGQKSLHGD